MSNPYAKLAGATDLEDIEGRFGCHADNCGRVTGEAVYSDSRELVIYTCPSGHKNEIGMKIYE